jgi:single-stranded DNA-binding protein
MTALAHIMTSTVVGHVTADPVSHGFSEPSGRYLHRCEFIVVVTRTDRDLETGETDAHPAFLTCRCKATLAKNVLATVRKGDLVIATGYLDTVDRPGPGGRSSQVILVAREVGLALSCTIDDDEDDA